MCMSNRTVIFVLCASWMLFSLPAYGINLNGAWAVDASTCDKIFVKKGNKISVAKNADLFGSGFVMEGNKIKGKMADCNIKARKEEAGALNLIVVCSTDIALSTVQFILRIDDDNKITRLFPGMPEMATTYVRCAF